MASDDLDAEETTVRSLGSRGGRPGLLSLTDAGSLLAVRDRRTVLRLFAEAGLPVVRLGRNIRIREQDLADLVERSVIARSPVLGPDPVVRRRSKRTQRREDPVTVPPKRGVRLTLETN